MTISSHNEVMKSAKVSELKARLSAYLAEVRSGGTVVVYDRATPIARLVPYQAQDDDLATIEASASPKELTKIKGVRPKKAVDMDKLLAERGKDGGSCTAIRVSSCGRCSTSRGSLSCGGNGRPRIPANYLESNAAVPLTVCACCRSTTITRLATLSSG